MKLIPILLAGMLWIVSISAFAETDTFQVEADGAYQAVSGESVELAKAVAVYEARTKAVGIAGRYLARKNLIKPYVLNRDEIYSLAAREIRIETIEARQRQLANGWSYHIRIRAWVLPSDFVKAEIEDMREARSEIQETYSEEMQQPVDETLDPGKDIAKAYRLLRERKWRIALIYLNHLQGKYPNWDHIHMAKALTHYILHETAFMESSLIEACRLGNTTACEDLDKIRKLGEHDFGLSIKD